MADSTQEQFLISTSLSSSIDQVYDLVPFKGKLYALTGDTDGILMEYNGSTWNQTFHDATGFKILLSGAVFENKLYMAALEDDGTGVDILSWDGTLPVSLTTEEQYAAATSAVLFSSKVFGLLYVGLNDGTIYSSADGSTYTSRDTSMDSVNDFTENSTKLFASGDDTGTGKIRQTANGTAFTELFTEATADCQALESRDEYVYCFVDDTSNGGAVKRINIAGTGTAITDTSTFDVTMRRMKWFRGWLYISDASGVLYRVDGHNVGSIVTVDTTGETAISCYGIFNKYLYIGSEESGAAKIFARRNNRAMAIDWKNQIALNPLLS